MDWLTGAKRFNANATVFTALPPNVVTALFGKYLNNADKLTPWPYVVPGVDEERMNKCMGYFDFTLVEKPWQGGPAMEVLYGQGIQNYQPYVLARRAANFIASVSARNGEQPFVAFVTPYAPHIPATAAPQDVGSCDALPLFRPVTYDAPRTGQPLMIVNAPAVTPNLVAEADMYYRKACEALRSTDGMVDSLMLALQTAGRLDDTYVIVTSDNGFHYGDLSLFHRKRTPYEGATNVAFMVRGPGVAPRLDNQHFAQIIDITPTILDLVGGTLPNLAGRSLVPLFSGALVGGFDDVLIEGLIPNGGAQRYSAVKNAQWKYVDFATGPDALYDLSDPDSEMHNLIALPAYAAQKATLIARLAVLKAR